jgi:hypothetical protein
MGLTVGPATWHPDYTRYLACTTALGCPVFGGFLFCKNGLGTAFIVAPYSTEVGSQWAGGQYNNTLVGDKCCVSEWSGLQTALTNAGLTPSQWFVPSVSQLCSAYVCKSFWGPSPCWSTASYWTSTDNFYGGAQYAGQIMSNGNNNRLRKCTTVCVRAFRCVTY